MDQTNPLWVKLVQLDLKTQEQATAEPLLHCNLLRCLLKDGLTHLVLSTQYVWANPVQVDCNHTKTEKVSH